MNLEMVLQNGRTIAVAESRETVILDAGSALDFLVNVKYRMDAEGVALNEEAVAEDFFILSTGLAGEVLQKFINYGLRFAVYGDFSQYTSKPLRDFIRESNRGNHVFFQPNREAAIEKLAE